jgi:hypothetical protein
MTTPTDAVADPPQAVVLVVEDAVALVLPRPPDRLGVKPLPQAGEEPLVQGAGAAVVVAVAVVGVMTPDQVKLARRLVDQRGADGRREYTVTRAPGERLAAWPYRRRRRRDRGRLASGRRRLRRGEQEPGQVPRATGKPHSPSVAPNSSVCDRSSVLRIGGRGGLQGSRRCGDRASDPEPHGQSRGVRRTTPATYVPSSTARRRCHGGSAGWAPTGGREPLPVDSSAAAIPELPDLAFRRSGLKQLVAKARMASCDSEQREAPG